MLIEYVSRFGSPDPWTWAGAMLSCVAVYATLWSSPSAGVLIRSALMQIWLKISASP